MKKGYIRNESRRKAKSDKKRKKKNTEQSNQEIYFVTAHYFSLDHNPFEILL